MILKVYVSQDCEVTRYSKRGKFLGIQSEDFPKINGLCGKSMQIQVRSVTFQTRKFYLDFSTLYFTLKFNEMQVKIKYFEYVHFSSIKMCT